MATTGCVFQRTLTRTTPGPNKASSSSPAICRQSVFVVELQRYSRDQGSSIYFPQAVLNGEDLYDITLTDRDCRLRVTLDPGLNRLVERHILRSGVTLLNATFTPTMTAQLPACPMTSGESRYTLVSVEVKGCASDDDDDEEDGVRRSDVDWDSLPWFGSSEVAVRCPTVMVSELREAFLSGHRAVTRRAVQHQLIIRIINKSHLMYYGRTDRNCECPYKAVLEVCDRTGSVCVVLWNSVCVSWYCRVKPGDIISLSRYRVKQHYQAEHNDIEISVNSRNPAARIAVLPESSVAPEYLPPAPTYSFYSSKELLDRPHGVLCDVIGLLIFSGRPERIRSKDGRGAELLEYRWLQLEDSSSDQPIMVKLFSTSQPETHCKLHPLSVVVCTRLKLIKVSDQTNGCFYLTNTTYTQVYCTGLGHHSEMSYRKLRPVQQFLQWLRSLDEAQVLSRALIGGFFIYPPPPVSLETYMKDRRGEPGFLQGADFQREVERLCYRERRTFCIQATIAMVTYCHRGEEDRCLLWMDRASLSPSSSSSSPRLSKSSSSPHLSVSSFSSSSVLNLPSTPRSPQPSLSSPSSSSSSPTSPFSAVSQLTPRLLQGRGGQKLNRRIILFEASMEFLKNTDEDDDNDDEDDSSFVTAPSVPAFPPVAMETLKMHYDHDHREEQAAAVALGGRATTAGRFVSEDYYTLRLKALSDGVLFDATFLPQSSSSSPSPPLLPHSNTWISILSHGAFSSHTPPPSPGDLIGMAAQLTNQRLVCILEVCYLGGASTEVVLSRAFLLTN
ncbi:hypothetical protein PAMP_016137 [Pampus punctatissimus]